MKAKTKKKVVPEIFIDEKTAVKILDLLDRKISEIRTTGRELWLISGILFSKREICKNIK